VKQIDAPAGTLTLRRKSVWEGADAGLLLWGPNIPALFLFFGLPLCAAAGAVWFAPDTPYTYIMLWWLKPLFDRLILHVIGVRFFEPRKTLPGLLAGLHRSLGRGLPGDLLWRRFSPRRSAFMPIRVLEGLKGARFTRRKRALGKGGLGFGLIITLVCFALEAVLLIGEVMCFFMLAKMARPDYFDTLSRRFFEGLDAAGSAGIIFGAYTCNFFLIESLYVCMGFALYLNSRIEVEGWDIELLFRPAKGQPKAVSTAGRV
jgi:hypothetical protein